MLDLQSLVQESSDNLNLKDFRRIVKNQQMEAHAKRGPWRAWSGFQLSEHLQLLLPNVKDRPLKIAYYAPRQDWDEAQFLPELPSNDSALKCYPRCSADELVYHTCTSSQLQFNRDYSVWEAPAHTPECTPDFIFVPSFACDMQGNRLGRGGGFYDKFLTRHPQIPHVGLVHSDYLFQHLPRRFFHSGDVRIRAILTERDFFFDLKEQL